MYFNIDIFSRFVIRTSEAIEMSEAWIEDDDELDDEEESSEELLAVRLLVE